jgi:hypothetical protein
MTLGAGVVGATTRLAKSALFGASGTFGYGNAVP